MKNSPSNKNQQGFSLIELLIVCVIMLFILGMMATIVSGVQSNYQTYRQRAEKHTDALSSLNLITRITRNANDGTQAALTATGNNRLLIKADWSASNSETENTFENVEFYVSNDTLYMTSNGSTTLELAPNIQSILFEYYDINGATTSTMANVAKVKVTLTIKGESQTLTETGTIRKMIQPK